MRVRVQKSVYTREEYQALESMIVEAPFEFAHHCFVDRNDPRRLSDHLRAKHAPLMSVIDAVYDFLCASH